MFRVGISAWALQGDLCCQALRCLSVFCDPQINNRANVVTSPQENAPAPALVQRPRVLAALLCSVPCVQTTHTFCWALVLVLVLLSEIRARSLFPFLFVKVVVRQHVANMMPSFHG